MFCENAQRFVLCVNNDNCTMSTLVNQTDGFSQSVLWSQGDGGLEDWVSSLHMLDHRLDDVQWDVLWKHH